MQRGQAKLHIDEVAEELETLKKTFKHMHELERQHLENDNFLINDEIRNLKEHVNNQFSKLIILFIRRKIEQK